MLRSVTLLDLVVVGGCLVWLNGMLTSSARRRIHPLPPGPPRLPYIGNVLDMPKSHLWEKAATWKKKYGIVGIQLMSFVLTSRNPGDIVYLENFGAPFVILNSYETTIDLLEKRSIKYSSRPLTTMVDQLSVNSSFDFSGSEA